GRAGPAAGSESCVVGGWPPLRSVDSQIKRCAIEPRNLLVVSLRRCQSRGPRQATHSWSTQPAWSHRGRRSMANDHKGSSGNLGDPASSIEPGGRLEIPPTNSRLIHGSASGAGGGTNNGRNDGIAKRRKRSAAKWAAGSRSTSEYRCSGGTNPRNPVKGRGCRLMSR